MSTPESFKPREPIRHGHGSSLAIPTGIIFMSIVLGTVAFSSSGCSNGVNALSRVVPADAGATVAGSCPAAPGAPTGVLPVPSPTQAAYQRSELTAFVHFGLETYDGTEQGDSAKDTPALFTPTALDATQWASALKSAGFREAMLTVKHGTGFCLWPSAHTTYSVKGSPWKSGQGDVLRKFSQAMRAAGLSVGFHLTPWDQHFPSSSADYETYFRNLLTEILTGYGPVDAIAFDGFLAPKALDWKGIFQLAKQLQPNILVWAGPEIATDGADLRWIGNQSGQGNRSTSSLAVIPNGGTSTEWYPAEAPVSVRPPNWFWHPGSSPVSLSTLQSIYFTTVGQNATLRLNIPPTQAGLLDAADVDLLRDFGAWYGSLYQTNFALGTSVTADSTWTTTGFDAAKAVDGDACTYWAGAAGSTSGRVEIAFGSSVTFKVLSLREPIELGERSTAYHVELKQNGVWNAVPTDSSGAPIKGTVIGQRQLWQLAPTTVEAVAVVIDSAKDVPALAEVGLY